MARISLIVAVADNGVIGSNNQLPWRISADLKYFKRVTLGKPIIMGRLTYESIGKPLPGRTNIVLSRDSAWRADGVERASDLNAALAIAKKIVDDSQLEELMIIGGATIYREALPQADRLYLTRVHTQVDGDAFFPELDLSQWLETPVEELASEGKTPACSFVRLDRK
ncbi:dihydrofolate reductase [Gammaproteobacteria bacterium 53_120_T64]|nr:dihydrofolate reductase [Gammaproteobacteria bacterium 53_120_T64]